MKNFIKQSFLSIVFGLFICNGLLAASPKDSLYCIEIDGKVLIPKNDDARTYRIELLCHNTVVDSGMVVDNESFLLKIKKNSWYTIRILKEGYFPMIVSIDTRLPEYNSSMYSFHFDTELIQAACAKVQDKEAVEFPIAIISFDQNQDEFLPVREYSQNIRRSIFEPQIKAEGLAKAYARK